MTGVRIKINRKAVGVLLKSDAVKADLARRAKAIAARAGNGHEVTSRVGRTRARASVRTATAEARNAEATSHNLTSSIDAGR